MNSADIKKVDGQKIVPTYNRFDLVIDHGKGARCWSADGREYIDFTSGIGVNSLGFCDDGWVKAVSDQAARLQHTSNLYFTEPCVKAADILTSRTGMAKVFFGNSGAEANEAAIKAARKYGVTKKGGNVHNIVTLENSFHGRTMATITATGQDHYHRYFTPFLDGFSYCRANDMAMMEELVDENTCAIMMELVQGEGGVLDLDRDFVRGCEAICREKDILLIIDEVQTGTGRTGSLFCYENFGIEPDIVTFAKGIGGGLPAGGAMYSAKCCDILSAGDHGTTYGGNPVVYAGVCEVLSRIDDDFLADVRAKGDYIRKSLADVPSVKSVSGMGLMIGIEVEGKSAIDVLNGCLAGGLMVLTAKDRVRLLPPLNITMEEVDAGLAILRENL